MKKFNIFKVAIMILVVAPMVLMGNPKKKFIFSPETRQNVASCLQSDRFGQFLDSFVRKSAYITAGWTGLSLGSFAGEKIWQRIVQENDSPRKKALYREAATVLKRVRCVTAIPALTVLGGVLSYGMVLRPATMLVDRKYALENKA